MSITNRCVRIVRFFALALTVLAVVPVQAQVIVETPAKPQGRKEGVRPSGLVAEVGVVSPLNANTGFLFGLSAGMGTLLSRHLDSSLGLRHWSADIDRSNLGTTTAGTFNDTSLDLVLAYPLMKVKGLRPYLGAGLAGHLVGADVPGDRSLEDALSGISVGALTVLGIGTAKSGLSYRLEARRDFVEDVGSWSYALGAGWWPKTRAGKTDRILQVDTPELMGASALYAPATGSEAGSEAQYELARALNHLKAENSALAAEMGRLREQLAQMAATPAAPAPIQQTIAPAPAPQPAPPAPDRGAMLFDTLARVTTLAGHPESLRRDGNNGLLTLDQGLLFAPGQSQLTTGAREELRRLAVVLLRFPEAQVLVQGHTDASGKAAANQKLSEQRAAAVRQELLSIMGRPDSIGAVGFGDTRPIATNDTVAGRARNRRVDLLITMPRSSSN